MITNLFTMEGPDFSGKSTAISKLKDINAIMMRWHLVSTREPGSYLGPGRECEEIRGILLNEDLSNEERIKLFAKSRTIHTKQMMKYLDLDMNIICDRYLLSSLVYQGYAKGVPYSEIYEANKKTIEMLRENNIKLHMIIFELSKENNLIRKNNRTNGSLEKLDAIEKDNELSNKVFEFYNDRSNLDEALEPIKDIVQVHYINANECEHDVFLQLLAIIDNNINNIK